MATIHLTETTTATPEQFVAALTDFGPGRQEIFGNSADGYFEVHDRARALGIVLGVFGKRVLGKALGNTVKAIEARDGAEQAPHLTPAESA